MNPSGSVGAVVQFLTTPLLPELSMPTGAVFHRLRHGHLAGTLGGVLSVSIPPSPGLDGCLRRTAEDLALARDLVARHGLAPSERALEPYRLSAGPPPDTAAIRVRLDAGPRPHRRWAVAQAVGPVLTAAFANSPLSGGLPTGWRSTRHAIRCRPVPDAGPVTPLREPPDAGRAGRLLDIDIDAQPGDGWLVAVAVATVLIGDPRAAEQVAAATEALPPDAWTRAARDGLTDPALAEAARHCFVAAYGALARQGVHRDVRDAVATYIQRYVNRRRSPADDLLSAVRART